MTWSLTPRVTQTPGPGETQTLAPGGKPALSGSGLNRHLLLKPLAWAAVHSHLIILSLAVEQQ